MLALIRSRGTFGTLAIWLALVWAADLEAARKLKPGDGYSSKSKVFTVTLPHTCSSFSLPYEVNEQAKKGDEFLEEAAFYMADMGELYHIGARRLTPRMRQQVNQPEGPLPPPALGWLGLHIHLAEREKRTGEWQPASEFETPDTKFGPGVMSVNHIQGGRFLRVSTFVGGKLVPKDEDRPAEVVVLIVQSGEHLVYVTGQADLGSTECVQREVWKMLEGLTLLRPLDQLR